MTAEDAAKDDPFVYEELYLFTYEEVARCAYHRWEARGKPDGDDQRDWFEALIELSELRNMNRRSDDESEP
jgi:DUF2934 family protein